jgi:hypothetical protein
MTPGEARAVVAQAGYMPSAIDLGQRLVSPDGCDS